MAYSSYHGNRRPSNTASSTFSLTMRPVINNSKASLSGASSQPTAWEATDIKELEDLVQKIDTGEQGLLSLGFNATRKWIPVRATNVCSNRGCKQSLSRLGWPNYCARCKEVFCKKCTNFQRRLNRSGHPDPNGRLLNVCFKCYDEGPQPPGQFYNHFEYFKRMRRDSTPSNNTSGLNADIIDYDRECQRLKEGFARSVGSSEVMRTIVDFRSMMKKPEWQKSFSQHSLSSCCFICKQSLQGTLKSSKTCSVCGRRVCRECSSKDLLVYIPDERKDERQPHLAIIEVIGCPQREPDLSLYLRICHQCCEVLKERQIDHFQSDAPVAVDNSEDFWEAVLKKNADVREIHDRVEVLLPKYQELIEAMEVNNSSNMTFNSKSKGRMQDMAKAQGDLADLFTHLLMILQTMKRIHPMTNAQSLICKNMSRCVYEYYQEHRTIYMDLRRRQEITTPMEVLECIQSIVDRNVLNSSYIMMKQLTFEVLHYTSKYHFDEKLVKKLSSAEDVVERDLLVCIEKGNENWEEHQSLVDQLLKEQLKEHRLIKPSKSMVKKCGSSHVESVMFERCEHIVREASLQVQSKCAERSFQRTKDVLKMLLDDVKTLYQEQAEKMMNEMEVGEWVLVH